MQAHPNDSDRAALAAVYRLLCEWGRERLARLAAAERVDVAQAELVAEKGERAAKAAQAKVSA